MDSNPIEDDLRRRMSPEADRERRQGLLAIVAGVILMLGIGAFFYLRLRGEQVAAVTAGAARITLEKDDGGSLASIDRSTSPELWYRVTLAGAPVGRTLALGCRWTNPRGEVAHENGWETKTITTATWDTHCRATFGPASIAGEWFVEMTLDGRRLSHTPFEMR